MRWRYEKRNWVVEGRKGGGEEYVFITVIQILVQTSCPLDLFLS